MTEEAQAQANFQRLKATRSAHRAATTRYINEIIDILQDQGTLNEEKCSQLKNLRARLEQKQAKLESIDNEILSICDVEHIDNEVRESEVINFKIIEVTSRIERALTTNEAHHERSSTSATETNSTTSETPRNETRSRSRLPKLDLQKFSGDILKFSGFWDRFETAIDKNSDIPKIEKFNYLKYYLEGSAARMIEGMQITETNYETAKEMIKKRFGQTQNVITAHIEELLKLKPTAADRPSQLRYLFDKISLHLRGLDSLGASSETHGSTLIPIVMGKLPGEIRIQVARLTTKEVWSMKELLELLENELKAREIGEAIRSTKLRIHFEEIQRIMEIKIRGQHRQRPHCSAARKQDQDQQV